MNVKKIPYYSIYRFACLCFGLWPYHVGIITRIQKCICMTILVSFILLQLGTLIAYGNDFWVCCKIVSYTMPVLVSVLKYTTFGFYNNSFKRTLDWVQADWDNYTEKREREIMAKHAQEGRTLFTFYTTIIYSAIFGVVFLPYLPLFFDIVTGMNRTHTLHLPSLVGCYIDPNKYYHLIVLHLDFCLLLGIGVIITTETVSLQITEHACGLFELTSYHVGIAVEDTILHSNESLMRKRIEIAVQIHYRALSFMVFLNHTYTLHYVVLLVLGILSLSLNLYIFAQAILQNGDLLGLMLSSFLIVVHLCYKYTCTYMCQIVLNASHKMFIDAYCTQWYLAPLPIQKFILLFLQRGTKNTPFVTGRVIQCSLETFLEILKKSISYFMVIWSMS